MFIKVWFSFAQTHTDVFVTNNNWLHLYLCYLVTFCLKKLLFSLERNIEVKPDVCSLFHMVRCTAHYFNNGSGSVLDIDWCTNSRHPYWDWYYYFETKVGQKKAAKLCFLRVFELILISNSQIHALKNRKCNFFHNMFFLTHYYKPPI